MQFRDAPSVLGVKNDNAHLCKSGWPPDVKLNNLNFGKTKVASGKVFPQFRPICEIRKTIKRQKCEIVQLKVPPTICKKAKPNLLLTSIYGSLKANPLIHIQ